MAQSPKTSPHPGLPELQSARALQRQGRFAEAKVLCDALVQQAPKDFEVLHLSGLVHAQLQQLAASVDLMCRAIAVRPDSHTSYYVMGYAMCQLRQYAAAVECFDKALALNPDYAEAACERGSALTELEHHGEALESYTLATKINPAYAAAWSNQGNALLALGQPRVAIARFDQALALDAQVADSWLNRGNAYQALGEGEIALTSYDRAIALRPSDVLAYSNRAVTLKHLHRFNESLASCAQALALDPQHADTYWNRGLTRLLLGDLRGGFADYQWRWKRAAFAPIVRKFQQPMWLGEESVLGKTVLLHAEQGLGDSLQFARYAQAVADLGANVVLEAEPALLALLTELPGADQLVSQGDPLPPFDLHCPLLTLPLALGTTLDSIPATVPYLRANPDLQAKWLALLGTKDRLRIGLVWSGSPLHRDDHNRSIPLAKLMAQLPSGHHYVSLQKEVRDSDQGALEASGLAHFGTRLETFADTAALCACMDLVISVDTSVAHLSGALGQATWILLPHLPDWRWLLERSDSPWYPSARLYRQTQARDWSTPLAQLAADLQALRA